MDEELGTVKDDIGQDYLTSRQIGTEVNSPAVLALARHGSNIPKSPPFVKGDSGGFPPTDDDTRNQQPPPEKGDQQTPPFLKGDKGGFLDGDDTRIQKWISDQKAQGRTDEEIDQDLQGLEDPWIDPTMAATGGFGAVGKMSLSAGTKLMPTFFKALTAGVSAGTAEYPLGMATEKVGEKFPKLALPFNVLTGMVSGVTLERAIEKGVIKGLSKSGLKVDAPEVIQASIKRVRADLDAGKVEDDLTPTVIDTINKEFPDVKAPPPAAEKAAIEARLSDILGDSEKPLVELAKETEKKAPQFLQTNIKDIPDKAININFSNINGTDQVKEAIAKTAEIFHPGIQTARRGKVSNLETAKLADLMGVDVKTLLKRRKGEAFNAHEALAARQVLVSSADHLVELSKKASTLDASDLDKFEFQKHLNLHYAIQAQVSGMTAEAGRALQAFGIAVKGTEGQTKAIKELLENLDQKGVSTGDLAQAVSQLDTVEGINKFAKKIRKANTFDMFLEAWINGLLSGPQTHAVNSLSNSLTAMWQIPERFLAANIGRLTPGPQAIAEKEALHQAFGMVEGFKDGLKLFAKTIKTGEPSDPMSKLEAVHQRAITAENLKTTVAGKLLNKMSPDALEQGGIAARAVDLLGEGARIPGRFLMAEDEFFKAIGFRMELNATAYRMAHDEGLKGEALALRIKEIVNDPPDELALAAMTAARYQTFTKPLGSAGKAFQKFVSKAPALRLIVPFIRTPTNIVKFSFERTPLAFASKKIRADIAAGGARRDLALARVSLGSMIMATMATLAAEGVITGGGPSDPQMKKHLYDQGWQPYSVKIGDKFYSYGRLEPMGMLFGMAADATEILGQAGDEDAGKIAAALVMSISKNVTSKTWVRGVSELLHTLDDPDRYGEKYVKNFVKSMVPAAVAQIERVVDPEMRACYSMLDEIKSRIPGYSDDLPPRRNFWAEPIVLGGGLGPDIISPIYTSEKKDSPISEELYRLEMATPMPKKIMSFEEIHLDLTPTEYDRYLVLMNEIKLESTGKPLKTSLNQLVKYLDYQAASDERKKLMIQAKILEAKDLAKMRLPEEVPLLRHLIDYGHQKRAALGY